MANELLWHQSDQEGAHHWLSVLTDLYNRGVKDILIACVDGLTGFPEAIESIYPKTEIQHCIIHQIRNSLKYVASKNQKALYPARSVMYLDSQITPSCIKYLKTNSA